MPDDPIRSSPRVLDLPPCATMGPGTADYQVVFVDGIAFMGWYGNVTDKGIEAWRSAATRVAERARGPIALVTCVRESSPPPEGELRKGAAKILFDDSAAVSLLVFEGTGFRAAIVRSVLAMMFAIVGNKKTAHKVIGDPTEAVKWFMDASKGKPWRPEARDLRRIVDALLNA